MVNKVKEFYENKSSDPNNDKLVPGLTSFFYKLLKKYEVTRIEKVYSLLDSGNRILDLGVGGGQLLAKCKINKKFNKLYGIDISSKVIDEAKNNIKKESRNLENVEIKYSDVNNGIPYPNKYFDSVTCIAVLEHLFDPIFFVKEVKRVLVNKGKIIVEVPNLVWLPRRLSIIFGKLPITGNEVGWDAGHLHYFTFGSLAKLLNDNSFEVERVTTSGIFSFVRQIMPSLLGGDIIIKAIKN